MGPTNPRSKELPSRKFPRRLMSERTQLLPPVKHSAGQSPRFPRRSLLKFQSKAERSAGRNRPFRRRRVLLRTRVPLLQHPMGDRLLRQLPDHSVGRLPSQRRRALSAVLLRRFRIRRRRRRPCRKGHSGARSGQVAHSRCRRAGQLSASERSFQPQQQQRPLKRRWSLPLS